jgi:hypothetical protein
VERNARPQYLPVVCVCGAPIVWAHFPTGEWHGIHGDPASDVAWGLARDQDAIIDPGHLRTICVSMKTFVEHMHPKVADDPEAGPSGSAAGDTSRAG